MKRITLSLVAILSVMAIMSSCDKKSYCPVEVNVPVVSADIPDTVDAGEMFTCDFVLDKGECIKEYGVRSTIINDTIWFFGRGMQDYCECLDDVETETSLKVCLSTYKKYVVIFSALDSDEEYVYSQYGCIVVR